MDGRTGCSRGPPGILIETVELVHHLRCYLYFLFRTCFAIAPALLLTLAL